MPLINPDLPEDGESADAADISQPFLDLLAVFNGHIGSDNLEPGSLITSNIADNAVTTAKIVDASITNAKLATTSGELGAAWSSYVPTWTALSGTPAIGNGTLRAHYQRIGKTIRVNINIIFGSTTVKGTGTWSFSLPTSMKADRFFVGSAWGIDTGVLYYTGAVTNVRPSAPGQVIAVQSNGAGTDWASTLPFTWGTDDEMAITYEYEEA